ncbi:MAG: polysaccharide biosynthesis/export family protein [Methylococcaceae bacterium]
MLPLTENRTLNIQNQNSPQKALTLLLMLISLSGCTIVPGMHMSQFSNQSSTEMPVSVNNETILKKLNIQTINAQLIVAKEKTASKRGLDSNNVANLNVDYRLSSNTIKGLPPLDDHSQYWVGPRDVLGITVWEHPELTIPAGDLSSGTFVGEDGNIFFPYAGIVKAADRPVEDIRAELTEKLSRYIEQVQLDVRVTSYRSQRVYVVGEVNKAGTQSVTDIPLTVLEAINGAGGVKSDVADLRNINLTRDGKTYGINLLSLYEGGAINQNIILKHGDVLNVPDNAINKVFVLGETGVGGTGSARSRSVLMHMGRMTLTEALSEGGGVNQGTADAARIFVFRAGIKNPEIFQLNSQSPDALLLADRFPMEPRDVVYVDRNEGTRWNQIIEQIQPTITLLNAFDGSLKVQPFIGQ